MNKSTGGEERDAIVEKIKKLLALADGNQNENERNVAMKFAMKLITKHNLHHTDLAISLEAQKIVEVQITLKLDPWVRYVVHGACALCYTTFIMIPTYRGVGENLKEWHPMFVGTEQNVECTIELVRWLVDSIQHEGKSLFKKPYERRSFYLGAAHKIYEKARQLVGDDSSKHDLASNSVVILRTNLMDAIDEFLWRKRGFELVPFRTRGTGCDKRAFEQGDNYGGSDRINDHIMK